MLTNDTVPLALPAVDGEKVTETSRLPPPATVAGSARLATAKLPELLLTEVMLAAPLPEFVSVTVRDAVVPT